MTIPIDRVDGPLPGGTQSRINKTVRSKEEQEQESFGKTLKKKLSDHEDTTDENGRREQSTEDESDRWEGLSSDEESNNNKNDQQETDEGQQPGESDEDNGHLDLKA